jgi:hypothetical protein
MYTISATIPTFNVYIYKYIHHFQYNLFAFMLTLFSIFHYIIKKRNEKIDY